MALDAAKQAFNTPLNLEGSTSELSKSKALLHELQLGEQLNECVHQARRADFSLMLAMLCEDVREQSQFVLPQVELDEKTLSTSLLRKRFDLPEQAPLALESLEQINDFNQAKDVAENNLINIHLAEAMKPKPLAFRDDNQHISSQIINNTTLVCQAKHAMRKTDAILNTRLAMNAEGWLKNIQMSLVKSNLSVDIAA